MSFEILDHESKWKELRDHLSENGFCQPTETSKIGVFLATIERWKPGMRGSCGDWWVCLPKSVFLNIIDMRDVDWTEVRAILDKNKQQRLDNPAGNPTRSADVAPPAVKKPFYEALLDEAREGVHAKALRSAFTWLLGNRTPSVTVGMVWFFFLGCHKQGLLEALGVDGKGALNQTEWDIDALLGLKG